MTVGGAHVDLIVVDLLLIYTVTIGLANYAVRIRTGSLVRNVAPGGIATLSGLDSRGTSIASFTVHLFGTDRRDNGGALVSPLSILYTLTVATGNTRRRALRRVRRILKVAGRSLGLCLCDCVGGLPRKSGCGLDLTGSV